MAYYRKTLRHADKVWELLTDAGDEGLSRWEIVEESGLTFGQVGRALNYIKDIFQDDRVQPLAYSPQTYHYVLTQLEVEETAYVRWSLKRLESMVRRLEPNIEAAHKKFDSLHFKHLTRNIQRVGEDLTAVLEDVDTLLA